MLGMVVTPYQETAMPRIATLALLLVSLSVVAAPVPTALKKPAFGPFGNLTDPKTKCQCQLKDGVLCVTIPADYPGTEPNEAGPIRLLAGRIVEGDFVLMVRASVPAALSTSSEFPEQVGAIGVGLAADDPQLGAAVLVGQETWGRKVNNAAIFRYSRLVQPRSGGLQGAKGVRTSVSWARWCGYGSHAAAKW
jgi:hypothetical protein